MNEMIKPVSVTKFTLVALIAVLILNFTLRIVFKLEGFPVTLGIAIGVAFLITRWFAKSANRGPTSQERSRFLWLYGGALALLFFALVMFLVFQKKSPNIGGLFILLFHYLPYPALAQVYFSEKKCTPYLKK